MKFEMNARLILIIGGLKVNRAQQINCKSRIRTVGRLNRVIRIARVQPYTQEKKKKG